MNFEKMGFAGEVLDIATSKPRFWEYLLYAELLINDVENVKIGLGDTFTIRKGAEFRFESIKQIGDLVNIFKSCENRLKIILEIGKNFEQYLPQNKRSAFGVDGASGDPFAIKIISSKVANAYYDVGLIFNESNIENELLEQFFEEKVNISSEVFELLRVATKNLNGYVINTARTLLVFIEEFGPFIKTLIEHKISGTEFIKSHTLHIPKDEEFLAKMKAVSHYFDQLRSITSINSSAHSKTPFAAEMQTKQFISTREVVEWLSGKSNVTLVELRNILMSLDLLPGAFIDEINERSLDATGDVALIENSLNIEIKQELLIAIGINWIS